MIRPILRKLKNAMRAAPRKDPVFEFSHSDSFYKLDSENIVFFDNRFENGFDQVLQYFSSGFLNRNNTRIIFKYYPANFHKISTLCGSLGIEWFCLSSHRHMPSLTDKLILYPFNSAANARPVTNRSCHHILLMHGESNKVACVKPLARLYDYVLVAGDLACERLVEFGIFTQGDISGGRAIKLGDTVLGDFHEITKNLGSSGEGAFAYFPTWEGGNEEENLCSLEHAESVFSPVLDFLDTKNIVIRFHPHTGERLHNYRSYANDLILKLLADGYHVTYFAIDPLTSFEQKLKTTHKGLHWHVSSNPKPLALSSAYVDVSALEAVLDSKLIPNLVYVDKDKFTAAPKRYWKLKAGHHVFKPDPNISKDMLNMTSQKAKAYQSALIGYSDEALSTMSHADRLVWLNTYVRTNRYWQD